MAETMTAKRPLVSIVLEGYTEPRTNGSVIDAMEELSRQDFPLDQVEVILVGSSEQVNQWRNLFPRWTSTFPVKAVEANNAHYYELKNSGAQMASGEILAFTDSDNSLHPRWLSAIVESVRNGADVVAGPVLFRSHSGLAPDHALMQGAASISFGWIVGKSQDRQPPPAVGFLGNNVAFRVDTFHRFPFRIDLGRTCAPSLLFSTLTDAGRRIVLQPKQQVAHVFSWRWWLLKFHFRIGYEVYLLRRLDKSYPNRWIARTKVFEPLITMGWHVLLDIPRWFRVSSLLQISPSRRVMLLPVVIAMSVAARTAEMAGMYATLLAPKAMKRWAESV